MKISNCDPVIGGGSLSLRSPVCVSLHLSSKTATVKPGITTQAEKLQEEEILTLLSL